LALQKVTSDTFFFIDDDVVISKKTFFDEMLKERSKRDCVALAPLVLPVKLTLWSLFFFNLYHLNMKYEHGAFFAAEYPMSCLLFDRRFLVKHQIVFDVTLLSGEDIDFTRKIFTHGGKIGISQKNKVQHHFATSFFSFMKKANWYASGILRKEAKNNLYYGYKPSRKAHVLLLPFFYLWQMRTNAIQLVKQFYVKDNMLIVPSFLFYFFILLHATSQQKHFISE
jgi:GT2 family glycosyltransferase